MDRERSSLHVGWQRALGLILAAGLLSIVNPGVLVAVPLALTSLFMPIRRGFSILVAVFAALLAFSGDRSSGFWYFERGWALIISGWFLALTMRWPRLKFISRGIGAVAGAFVAVCLVFWSRPGQWAVVDGAVTSRVEDGVSLALRALRESLGPGVLPGEVEARMHEAVAFHGVIFPSLLGLASLAGLGAAWWLYLRLNKVREPGLSPLREFRFNDQLVWVLILGLLLLLGSSGIVGRLGINAVVFMAGLYTLRGIAVALALLKGPTGLLSILIVAGFLVAAPFFVVGAFVFGLGDTWLNLRARLEADFSR
jgi:hypothetical protein